MGCNSSNRVAPHGGGERSSREGRKGSRRQGRRKAAATPIVAAKAALEAALEGVDDDLVLVVALASILNSAHRPLKTPGAAAGRYKAVRPRR